MAPDITPLLEPLRIGQLRLRNRLVMTGMQRFVRRGDFDLVSVGRSLIGDPDWVAKMSDGRGGQIRPFRRCDIEFLSALCLSPCCGCPSSSTTRVARSGTRGGAARR